MSVSGSGVGFFLIFFIYFIIALPILILVAVFIKEFRQKLLIFSSTLSLLFLPSLYKEVRFTVENNIWGNAQLNGAIWLFFSITLLIILLIYFVLRKYSFFRFL